MEVQKKKLREATRLDMLLMSGFVLAFEKVLFPLGLVGMETLTSQISRLRGKPLQYHVFDHGGKFLYPVYDSYWGCYFLTRRKYEAELEILFGRVLYKGIQFSFIDGGANFGYWSCFLSRRQGLVKPIIAIEPTRETFEILRANAELNEGFHCLQAAVMDKDGASVSVIGNRHASRRVASALSPRDEVVPSVTVDSIIRRYCGGASLVIIKLDIEGAEPQAFMGATRALEAGYPVIFECHGSDLECRSTSAALSHGLAVYFLTEEGTFIQITNLDALVRLKSDPNRGYNLLGVRPHSQFEYQFLKAYED